jgi:DNA-binding ferritin-like protein
MGRNAHLISTYRNRAEELRVKAETMDTLSARESLMRVAEDYENMAAEAERKDVGEMAAKT